MAGVPLQRSIEPRLIQRSPTTVNAHGLTLSARAFRPLGVSLSIAIQQISTLSLFPGRHGEHVRADRRRYRPSKFVGFAFTRILRA
jgi:hypothetical protein